VGETRCGYLEGHVLANYCPSLFGWPAGPAWRSTRARVARGFLLMEANRLLKRSDWADISLSPVVTTITLSRPEIIRQSVKCPSLHGDPVLAEASLSRNVSLLGKHRA
jgi:hypothetical protein